MHCNAKRVYNDRHEDSGALFENEALAGGTTIIFGNLHALSIARICWWMVGCGSSMQGTAGLHTHGR